MKYRNTRTGIIIDTDCACVGKYWKKLEETSAFSSIAEQPEENVKPEETKNEAVIEPVKKEVKAVKETTGVIINPKKGKKK